MPTENRSSNTEMVAQLSPCPHCGQQDAFVEQLDSDASVVICQGRIDEYSVCLARGPVGVQQHECEDQPGHDQAVKEWNKRAAAAPHPDPIAWMVGTAFWWTKEEAERDAAAMGLPVVPLGPMGGSGNPSAWLNTATGAVTTSAVQVMDWDDDGEPVQSLYTHADPGEVERLRIERGRMDQALVACANERDELRKANTEFDAQAANDFKFIDDLRAQLAEAQAMLKRCEESLFNLLCFGVPEDRTEADKMIDELRALSASAEPSAPVERHDETLIDALLTCEKWFIKHSPTAPLIGGFGDAEHPMLTCIRAALERKLQVKS